MHQSQLGDYRVPSDPQMHPDGVRGAYTVTQMDVGTDEYIKQVHILDEAGDSSVIAGGKSHSPRWSPDGNSLAYLTSVDDDIVQLAVYGVNAGEHRILTSFAASVSELAWSPDGSTIALVVSEHVDGFDDDEERKRSPRRILAPSFRYDNKSWTYNKRTHLWLVDPISADARQLTFGDHSEEGPGWSPDGSTITFRSATHQGRWIDPLNSVFTVPASGGDRQPAAPLGDWSWSGFDANGALLALGVGGDKHTLELSQFQLLDPGASATAITSLDLHVNGSSSAGASSGPLTRLDGGLTFIAEDRGTWRTFSLDIDGVIHDLASGPREITGWHSAGATQDALFTATLTTSPGEVYRSSDGVEERTTTLNDAFCTATELVEPQEFSYLSDGVEIHGWVYLPRGDEPVPILFNIHGGPATQYGWGFFDEFQVYVGAGYGVVAINPRGSSGYGFDHVQAPVGHWGDDVPPDFADLTAAPYEAAKLFPRLDLDRMGVMGGSYGGLATVMVTALDDRYVSAIAERGVYNWVSFAGTSDIPYFVETYNSASMPDDVDAIWKASSLARASAITTPMLVIHSEDDFRCPVEQGQQLFTLLYSNGVETELVLFPPGEGHELSRSGKPKHRVERFDAILAWHDRHLEPRQ